jgi:DNA-binding LytR/AlgR family response regulator
LDPEKFRRIHRGTIINAAFVTKVSRSLTGRYAVKVKGYDAPLMVSRIYGHLFLQM